MEETHAKILIACIHIGFAVFEFVLGRLALKEKPTHHGLHLSDGVTHYHGNYGNFLFLWDVLFGTAKITRRRPEAYGIEGLEPIPVANELLWPVPARELTLDESEHSGVRSPQGA